MVTVKQILQVKGYDIWSVNPDDMVYYALKFMADKNVGAMLVIDNGNLKGIFSERDYARRLKLEGRSSIHTKVSDLMTRDVVTITPDKNIDECMALMTQRHIRHLPVVEDDKLIGVISIGDVVNRIIIEQNFALKELENYIAGSV